MTVLPEKIIIRKGGPDDLEAVYALIKELAEFEKEPEEPSNPFDVFYEQGTGKYPWYMTLVAEYNGQVIAMALYYNAYSTWKGAMFYLDDIVVNEKFRRYGVGSLLLNQLLQEAKTANVNMVKWQVLDWNQPAIRFYEKYKAEIGTGEWLNCRIQKDGFNINI